MVKFPVDGYLVRISMIMNSLICDLQNITFAEKKSNAGELPGAALLCLSFMPKDLKNQGASRVRYLCLVRFCSLRIYYAAKSV